ncbi:MAG: hypothetical protein QOH66_1296 [Actinomycetota bacterium]|nr:hypothetical protein [Actinomycetota bacterium]
MAKVGQHLTKPLPIASRPLAGRSPHWSYRSELLEARRTREKQDGGHHESKVGTGGGGSCRCDALGRDRCDCRQHRPARNGILARRRGPAQPHLRSADLRNDYGDTQDPDALGRPAGGRDASPRPGSDTRCPAACSTDPPAGTHGRPREDTDRDHRPDGRRRGETGACNDSCSPGDQPAGAQSPGGALAPRTHADPGADPHDRKAQPHPDTYPDPDGDALERPPPKPVPEPFPNPEPDQR